MKIPIKSYQIPGWPAGNQKPVYLIRRVGKSTTLLNDGPRGDIPHLSIVKYTRLELLNGSGTYVGDSGVLIWVSEEGNRG